jgi:hypothetical protein
VANRLNHYYLAFGKINFFQLSVDLEGRPGQVFNEDLNYLIHGLEARDVVKVQDGEDETL